MGSQGADKEAGVGQWTSAMQVGEQSTPGFGAQTSGAWRCPLQEEVGRLQEDRSLGAVGGKQSSTFRRPLGEMPGGRWT